MGKERWELCLGLMFIWKGEVGVVYMGLMLTGKGDVGVVCVDLMLTGKEGVGVVCGLNVNWEGRVRSWAWS